MSRPKKNESKALVHLVEEFFEFEANGDPKMLRYTAIAAYAKNKGFSTEAYDLRRDEAVRKKIAELRLAKESDRKEEIIAAYRNLDVEAFLRNAGSIDELKGNIRCLDAYWRRVYDETITIKQENERLSQNTEMYQKTQTRHMEDIEQYSRQNRDLQRENQRLTAENAYLKRILRHTLYPAIAQELLRQSSLPMPENHTVRPEAMMELIEGQTPQPFTGEQGEVKKPLTHQEVLMAEMEAQVKNR